MWLQFLFARPGMTVTQVARAAEVHHTTASRWKAGKRKADWEAVTLLYARGILTDDDLRAAGLAIPRAARGRQSR